MHHEFKKGSYETLRRYVSLKPAMAHSSHKEAALPYGKKLKALTALADTELSEGEITARNRCFYVNICARVL